MGGARSGGSGVAAERGEAMLHRLAPEFTSAAVQVPPAPGPIQVTAVHFAQQRRCGAVLGGAVNSSS